MQRLETARPAVWDPHPGRRFVATNASGRGASPRLAAMAADLVLVIHTAVALFAVLGGFLLLLDPRLGVVHLPVVAWSSVVNLAGWTCPLTPLEQRLRVKAGQGTFEGGWIQHHLEPVVRPLGMPRRMELIAGVSVAAWNILVYTGVLWLRQSA